MDYSTFAIIEDLLSHFFLDNLYLWYQTKEMSVGFTVPETDPEPAIGILRQYFANGRTNLSGCVKAFQNLPYFESFLEGKGPKVKTVFYNHLKKYVSIFLPAAGFEICSTNRYTGQPESCIVATKDWQAEEYIKYCAGFACVLTNEEDQLLRSEGRDFSVMLSQRKNSTFLFLGPARFVNHDCDPNCAFVQQCNEVTFRARRNIVSGEEMTVSYGINYFGNNNCECRCMTCEKLEKGFYTKAKTIKDRGKNEQEKVASQVRRSSRKRSRKSVDYSSKHLKKNSGDQVKLPAFLRSGSSSADSDLSMANTDEAPVTWVSTIKAIMSIVNICNPSSYTPKLSSLDPICIEEQYQQYVGTYPDSPTAVSSTSLLPSQCLPPPIDTLLGPEASLQCDDDPIKCCPMAKVYMQSSESKDKCVRCYRHYKIYGLLWPQRRVSERR